MMSVQSSYAKVSFLPEKEELVTGHLLFFLSLKEWGRFVSIWPLWIEKPRSPGATLSNYPPSSNVLRQSPPDKKI
jgi:hypothetical protein